jgi:glycosyltransferase involved in cell wall biosynthesis
MAFGTVPIVTPEVSVSSYMETLIEDIHYILVRTPEELKEKISNINEEQWTNMSKSCYEWYQRNVHSKNCWKNMVENILYH